MPSDSPIARYLNPGERILWQGQPDSSIWFTRSDVITLPFSLVLTGFASLLVLNFFGVIVADPKSVHDPIAMIFSVTLLVVGLYMLIGRFFYKAFLKRRTYYAITDARVLMVVQGLTGTVRSLQLANLPVVEKIERHDGSGTLRFGMAGGALPTHDNMGLDFAWSLAGSIPAFFDIQKVNEPYQIIQDLIAKRDR
jgi:hypothetical protein